MSKKAKSHSYCLTRHVLAKSFRLSVTKARFEKLKVAFDNIRHVTNIEEEWEAVLQNYLELEKALLDAAARSMLVRDHDFFSFHDARIRFAVRLSNLLSSCKSYLDHTPHHLNSISPKADYASRFDDLTHVQYDKRFGYRLMEALRSHAQHRGLPIHGTSFSSSWVDGGDDGLLSFSVTTQIRLDRLREDKKFKKSILKGITGEHLEAEPHVRDYIEGLSAIHVETRKLLEPKLLLWKALIREAIAEYEAAAPGEKLLGLCAVELDEPYTWVRQVPLFEDFVALSERYERRNGALVNFAKRFVTSAQKLKKKSFQ